MKELIKKLTEHYAWCIENMPEENWLMFTLDNDIIKGICLCASDRFNLEIYGSKFVEDFRKGFLYLCQTPSHCETFKEALETLRIRHKRLLEMADYVE